MVDKESPRKYAASLDATRPGFALVTFATPFRFLPLILIKKAYLLSSERLLNVFLEKSLRLTIILWNYSLSGCCCHD
jgi:hypothetical protein